MNAAFFRELGDLRTRHGAGDAKFRHVGGIRMWLGSGATAASLFAFGKSALAFGLLEGGLWVMALTWLMAEMVSRAFRLALLSGVLLAGFAAGSFFACSFLAEQITGLMTVNPVLLRPNLDSSQALTIGIGLLLTCLALAAFYLRFRVPLTVAVAIALLFVSLSGIGAALAGGFDERWDRLITLIFSALVLVLAVRVDLTDPQRSTRRSDVAFWLYILAGLSAVFTMFSDFAQLHAFPDPMSLITLLLVLIAFGVSSLVIDRRALIGVPLFYSGTMMAYTSWRIHGTGFGLLFWLFGTGLLMLGLALYWSELRAKLIPLLPLGRRLANLLPPANGESK